MTEDSQSGFRDSRLALLIALLRSREIVMRNFRPMLAGHGLSEQQWRVIRILGEFGRLDATAVGQRAIILGPSLTRIIRLLEDRGLLRRTKDKADGRRFLLELTEDGQSMLDEIGPQSSDIYERISRAFGAAKLETLIGLLNDLSMIQIEPLSAMGGAPADDLED